jgi:chemotaxis protein methyltransferase CheR
MSQLTPAIQQIFAELLERRTGQFLNDGRAWRIDSLLGPLLRERRLPSLDALAKLIKGDGDRALADQVIEALLNHESFFFRDPHSFAQLCGPGLAQLRAAKANKRLRIWSAGCANGQEAYSLAMAIGDEPDAWAGWQIEILATDLSKKALDYARCGVYSQFEVQRGLPIRQMLRWFQSDIAHWRASDELKQKVVFANHNLLDVPPAGKFDVIMCRNVMLYFTDDVRARVFTQLRQAIADHGLLMLGAGETVSAHSIDFTTHSEMPGFFRPVSNNGLISPVQVAA